MKMKYFSFVKPIVCPKCHKPYKVFILKDAFIVGLILEESCGRKTGRKYREKF